MAHITEKREGWGWPPLARRTHYFVGRVSLCGRWEHGGCLEDRDDSASVYDCVPCRRALDRRMANG